jgi:hypothetical protein
MPFDTSMYLQNPLRSVADYENQYRQARLNALALQQGRMKMAEYQRGLQEQDQVRNLLSQTKTPEEAINVLRSGGFVTQADAIEKGMVARRAQEATSAKTGAEVTAAHYKLMKDLTGVITQDPTQQTAMAVLDDWERQTKMPAGAVRQAFAQAGDNPEQIRRLAFSIAAEADKLLPKTERIDTGGAVQIVALDPVTGKPTVTGTATKTQTPDSVASVNATLRGQNMTDSRERERTNLQRDMLVSDAGGPTQAALVKRFGKAEPGRRWKEDGSQEPIPGGSADQKTELKRAGQGTVDSVVAELRNYFDSLDASGGITNPDKGSLANMPANIASTGIGQATGRMFGTQNQSQRNKIIQARPLLLQAIMKASGLSAKQMDSNAELKLWLSTATDPTLDVQANKAALARIEALYGSGGTGDAGPVKVNSVEEANKLPKGTRFIDPNGVERVR